MFKFFSHRASISDSDVTKRYFVFFWAAFVEKTLLSDLFLDRGGLTTVKQRDDSMGNPPGGCVLSPPFFTEAFLNKLSVGGLVEAVCY